MASIKDAILRLRITGDSARARRELRRTKADVQDLKEETDQATESMKDSWNDLKGVIAGVGAAAAAVAAALELPAARDDIRAQRRARGIFLTPEQEQAAAGLGRHGIYLGYEGEAEAEQGVTLLAEGAAYEAQLAQDLYGNVTVGGTI